MESNDVETLQAENDFLRRQLAAFHSLAQVNVDCLSSRELQIFVALGVARSTLEIAASMHLSTSTIDTYRERIKSKLDLKSGHQLLRLAILYVIQNGVEHATVDSNPVSSRGGS